MFDFTSQVWEWIGKGVGYFFGYFKTILAGLVGRVLGTFGLSLVTFESILPNLKDFLAGFMSNLPPALLQMVSAVGLDVAMTMVISALSVRMAWRVFVIPTTIKNQMMGGG